MQPPVLSKYSTYFWTLWNRSSVLMCHSAASTWEKFYEQLLTAPSLETTVMFRTTQRFMLFGFLLYAPNPLCTKLTLPKPQTLMLCCSEPTSQAVSCCSSHSVYSPLLPELGMHPVFLRKHQNKMWSLYAVEMAVWAAGLGHVLHASDKKKNIQTQCKSKTHHVAKVAGNGKDRALPTHTDRFFPNNSSNLPSFSTFSVASPSHTEELPRYRWWFPLAARTLSFLITVLFLCTFLLSMWKHVFS